MTEYHFPSRILNMTMRERLAQANRIIDEWPSAVAIEEILIALGFDRISFPARGPRVTAYYLGKPITPFPRSPSP